jgi:uncharacterized membrane protein YkoI
MGVLRASISAAVMAVIATGICLEASALVHNADAPDRVALGSTSSMSMDQAVKMAEQRFKARVVRAETQRDGVKTVYVLKLLNEAGRVWTVRVDAANGAVL